MTVVDDKQRRARIGWALVGALVVVLVVAKLYLNLPPDDGCEGRRLLARRELLRQLLARVSTTLRQAGVAHWLAFGTLKSWHESRHIAPTAYDIDLGVMASQVPLALAALTNALPADEYAVVPAGVMMGPHVVHRATGLTLEMTTYVVDAANVLHPSSPGAEWRRFQCHAQSHFPAEFILPLTADMLDGVDVPIPQHYLRLLDAWYANGELCRPSRQQQPTVFCETASERPVMTR
jgi:hypothetical protein